MKKCYLDFTYVSGSQNLKIVLTVINARRDDMTFSSDQNLTEMQMMLED